MVSCFMVSFCVSNDLSGIVSEITHVARVSLTVSPRGAFDKNNIIVKGLPGLASGTSVAFSWTRRIQFGALVVFRKQENMSSWSSLSIGRSPTCIQHSVLWLFVIVFF